MGASTTWAREHEALGELDLLSNEGRWGADDELGALNLVGPEAVRRAAAAVRTGRVYALGEVIASESPDTGEPRHPMRVRTTRAFGAPVQSATDGLLLIALHGAVTHIDALCHVGGSDRRLYNGIPQGAVGAEGASRLGVQNLRGVVTRGVLLDVAGLHDTAQLPADHLVTADDLAGSADRAGTEIMPGDAVLVRTGWRNVVFGDARFGRAQPGIGPSAAVYLARRDVCIIGSDTPTVEATNLAGDTEADRRAREGLTDILHPWILRQAGIYLLELLNLDEIASDLVTEFQLCIAPLLISGGTTSPLNPLAVC